MMMAKNGITATVRHTIHMKHGAKDYIQSGSLFIYIFFFFFFFNKLHEPTGEDSTRALLVVHRKMC